MKTKIFRKLLFVILFSLILNSIYAQPTSVRIKNEITGALKEWNAAAKSANADRCLSLFENSDDIILVGSDKGEICKGKLQIREWLSQIFAHANFSWEMNTIDIDSNGSTAWVFVDGSMIVQWDNGKTKITPYRFTGIMVRKNKLWKWKLFNGSIPRGE